METLHALYAACMVSPAKPDVTLPQQWTMQAVWAEPQVVELAKANA